MRTLTMIDDGTSSKVTDDDDVIGYSSWMEQVLDEINELYDCHNSTSSSITKKMMLMKKANEIFSCWKEDDEEEKDKNDDKTCTFVVDVCKLRKLAVTEDGYVCRSIRNVVWPILTNCHHDDHDQEKEPSNRNNNQVVNHAVASLSSKTMKMGSLSENNNNIDNNLLQLTKHMAVPDNGVGVDKSFIMKYHIFNILLTLLNDDDENDTSSTSSNRLKPVSSSTELETFHSIPLVSSQSFDDTLQKQSDETKNSNIRMRQLMFRKSNVVAQYSQRQQQSEPEQQEQNRKTNKNDGKFQAETSFDSKQQQKEELGKLERVEQLTKVSSKNDNKICLSSSTTHDNKKLRRSRRSYVKRKVDDTRAMKTISKYHYYSGLVDLINMLLINLYSPKLTVSMFSKLARFHFRDALDGTIPHCVEYHTNHRTMMMLSPMETLVVATFVPLIQLVCNDVYNGIIDNDDDEFYDYSGILRNYHHHQKSKTGLCNGRVTTTLSSVVSSSPVVVSTGIKTKTKRNRFGQQQQQGSICASSSSSWKGSKMRILCSVVAKHVSTWFCTIFENDKDTYSGNNNKTNGRSSSDNRTVLSSRFADVFLVSHPLMPIYVAVAFLSVRHKYKNSTISTTSSSISNSNSSNHQPKTDRNDTPTKTTTSASNSSSTSTSSHLSRSSSSTTTRHCQQPQQQQLQSKYDPSSDDDDDCIVQNEEAFAVYCHQLFQLDSIVRLKKSCNTNNKNVNNKYEDTNTNNMNNNERRDHNNSHTNSTMSIVEEILSTALLYM